MKSLKVKENIHIFFPSYDFGISTPILILVDSQLLLNHTRHLAIGSDSPNCLRATHPNQTFRKHPLRFNQHTEM